LQCIAAVGAATALTAAAVATVQTDIKRVLAFSTVSQLGYMFLALGSGAFGAAVFHLFTHAFFKACLFLSAGSVIHALGGEQDMRMMGGLRRDLPVTYRTTLIAALALAGAPFTAGFFSKDLILWQVYAAPHGSLILWLLGWATAGLTAFYIFRSFFMVFHGERRTAAQRSAAVHESPPVMTVPLMLLALGSVFAGWVGAPEYLWGSLWDHWLEPVFGHGVSHADALAEELSLTVLTLAAVAAGIYWAYRTYAREAAPRALARWLRENYFIDQLYDSALVRPFTAGARWLARRFDPEVVDGAVHGVARWITSWSAAGRRLQTGNVQHYLMAFLLGALALLSVLV
jgi:NADH-quinone oxidoreductase subunit L